MKKINKREWFAGISSLVTFLIVLRTLHDMQTAQGVGLYLSILGGYNSRVLFDVMVDVLGLVLLALLLLIPCFLLGFRNSESFFRLLAAYLALLPGVDLAALVHIFDPPGLFHLPQALVEGDVLNVFLAGMKEISPVLRLWLPIFFLLLMGDQMMERKGLKRWQIRILWFQIPLLLGVFLFPAISSFLAFAMQYLLLIVCFDIWEGWNKNLIQGMKRPNGHPYHDAEQSWNNDLIQGMKRPNGHPYHDAEQSWYNGYSNIRLWGMVLFGGFWLRGLYLMIEVMSIWE